MLLFWSFYTFLFLYLCKAALTNMCYIKHCRNKGDIKLFKKKIHKIISCTFLSTLYHCICPVALLNYDLPYGEHQATKVNDFIWIWSGSGLHLTALPKSVTLNLLLFVIYNLSFICRCPRVWCHILLPILVARSKVVLHALTGH